MQEGEAPAERLGGEGEWTGEDFRWYLLAVSHNTDDESFYLQERRFPNRILLSSVWHETFARLRKETLQDGHERWGLVAADSERKRLFISQSFLRAHETPGVLYRKDTTARISLAAEQGLPWLVADLHTHPSRAGDATAPGQWQAEMQNYFSLGDLYTFLSSKQHLSARFLVGPTMNRMALVSRETRAVPVPASLRRFAAYWHRRESSIQGQNLEIAKRYRLALYEGEPGRGLVRISSKRASA